MTNTNVPASSSRKRELPGGNETAGSRLELGEFNTVPSLSLSEARLLINAVIDVRGKNKRRYNETETLTKTTDWLSTFSRFQRKENIEAVDALLRSKPELDSFERSQLGSLCCESAEEAKFLVPSLNEKIDDDELGALLQEISNLRTYE